MCVGGGGLPRVRARTHTRRGCRSPNPVTRACSCPPGASAQSLRVIADAPGGVVGSTIVLCALPAAAPAAAAAVTICAGVTADNTGQVDAAAAINACVTEAGAGGRLALPAGTYLIASVAVDVGASGFTLTTEGFAAGAPGCGWPGAAPCATLRAAPGLASEFGVLSVHDANDVQIDAIVLDGNRGERLAPAPAGAACASPTGNRAIAYTSGVHNCALLVVDGGVGVEHTRAGVQASAAPSPAPSRCTPCAARASSSRAQTLRWTDPCFSLTGTTSGARL